MTISLFKVCIKFFDHFTLIESHAISVPMMLLATVYFSNKKGTNDKSNTASLEWTINCWSLDMMKMHFHTSPVTAWGRQTCMQTCELKYLAEQAKLLAKLALIKATVS